ncbi:RNA polymerase sigma factor [Sphingobacterium hotanense]|uniref:RNA polymerase sigma factor n=1 Tax=Sphingobacterium hotanense TaxID=649196 RepID=UPI0021A6B5A8|nr:RNA polymerase sigma-70 factor [Sphingobacterium hotanense]MCT1523884.1 RNA polymerase sigma-70 factor [Sphingobacterium hotanense]
MKIFPIADEIALISDLQSGNRQAFEIIYHRHKGILYNHATKLLKNQDVASDIIHDIFLNLWNNRNTLSIKENLSAYLFQSVRNRVVNYQIKNNRDSQFIQAFTQHISNYQNSTDFLVREKMLTELIEKELEYLPPRMRAVFNLSRKEGLSHKEIAEQLQISEQSVRSHIKNSLRVLRLRLGTGCFLLISHIL